MDTSGSKRDNNIEEKKSNRKKWTTITKQELEKPCGTADSVWSNQEILKHLQSIYFLDEKLRITQKGMEFLTFRFKKMQRAEMIMIERYFLERFNLDVEIDYSEEKTY